VIRQRYTFVRFHGGARLRSGDCSLLWLTPMILIAWHLMPAGMHTRWNRETWESEIYFAYNILTGRKSLFPSDMGSRQALPNRPLQLRRKIYFTYNILTGRKSLLPSDMGSRQALQFVRGLSVAKFISPITI
jgi:hypothetical protein